MAAKKKRGRGGARDGAGRKPKGAGPRKLWLPVKFAQVELDELHARAEAVQPPVTFTDFVRRLLGLEVNLSERSCQRGDE